ncbi:MAG: SdpI family protein [Lacisediminihabitans sp.]
MLVATIVIIVVALAAPLVMHACAAGRIPVNHLVGIRIASVMESAQAWRAGHKAAIPVTWIGAIVAVVIAGISLTPVVPPAAESGVLIAAAIVFLVAIVLAGVVANRAALVEIDAEQHQAQH